MRLLAASLVLASLVSFVVAHGYVKSPPTRTVGSAMIAACGQGPTDVANRTSSNGPIESQIAKIGSDFNPFADNTDRVQAYQPGQVLNIVLDIINHHPVGYANVSVIDSATNTAIGAPLIAWDPYFTGYPYPKDQG
ncbi:putative effector protein [Ceratobasidium theobromae]|uniref:Putative effector protein n=1 Tax=Ceratobasidium theobromae TaxID=1582974 RepID=A0A5N5QK56_9AGAM|nr:putative effector protein [Ceratobasidium theobromae]